MIEEKKEEEHPNNYRCVTNGLVRVKVVMEPKSLALSAPLNWDIGKVKCVLCQILPKIQWERIKLSHDG